MRRAALFLMTAGCAAALGRPPAGTATITPDGRPAIAIDCGNDLHGCWEDAAKVCPRGYDVVRESDGRMAGQVESQRPHYEQLIVCRPVPVARTP